MPKRKQGTQSEAVYMIEKINPVIARYVRDRRRAGHYSFALEGGRRSGKTFFVCQFLLSRVYKYGHSANVASMTQEQGRLGAFGDFKRIIEDCPTLEAAFDILESPREIRCKFNGGKIFFNSYRNAETAKGIACDWLFLNEANAFSKQQVIDLLANVRLGWFADYNPGEHTFWIDDFFTPSEICHTTWRDNARNLTPMQLRYFEQLKIDASKPNASPVDIRNYRVYYLGERAEVTGKIFFPENLTFRTINPETIEREGLHNFTIFCDPSALRGADWFACVLSAIDKIGRVWFVDAWSINQGTREQVTRKLYEWCSTWDVKTVYVETNGIIGIDYFEFAQNSGLPVEYWYSRGKKFDRICGNYQNLTHNAIFSDTIPDEFLAQVYEFDEKCEHDDNIDALNSSYNAQAYALSAYG